VRVALIALEVARAAGASEHQLLLVGNAGLLHDIGKSRLPQEVLFKQGALDEDEWRAMAEHPRLGAQLLVEQDDVHPSAIGAAFCHHMAPAGGGYPDALVRFDPSGISRLIRICDVFEALTAVRPYKRDLTPLEAMARMNRQAEQFDRRWLRFFFRTVGIYPIGTRLRLDGGESALVVRHGSSCERPVVRLLTDAAGRPLAEDRPELEIGVPVDGRTPRVAAVLRRRGGQEYEDSSARAVAPIHHACLGPEPAGHDSRPHG
jgi:HD-GYP domain-containing protein (c-di-GMP phosphodiesterase class II)